MDIDSIPPGVDFEEHIRQEIQICDMVLVLIGDEWLDAEPGTSLRRIDQPNDFVRLEIESAFALDRKIIPVLVEGAQMPRATDLPDSIQRLARINAFELSDRRWTADLERLAAVIENAPSHQDSRSTMSLSDIQEGPLRAAVAAMPPQFTTKDVSENPAVLNAHGQTAGTQNYHSIIGTYLAKNHTSLGLLPPEGARNDRGAVWRKAALTSTPGGIPHPAPAAVQPAQLARSGGSPAARRQSHDGTTAIGWVMIALPVVSCGLAAFVPALWAASQRRHDTTFRRRMLTFAAAIGICSIGGLVVLVSSPTDASGTPSGVQSDIGGVIWLCATLVATGVAVVHRKPGTRLPGTEREFARRQQREQYRRLVKSDPNLARSIGVGRPDQNRDYDDGGLLDINRLSAEALNAFGAIPMAEAQQIVSSREHLGRVSGVEEIIVYANVSETTASKLREIAVIL